MSFEEKSVWIQWAGTLLVLAGYGWVAGQMLAAGVLDLRAYAAVFMASVACLVAILVAAHIVAALTGRPEDSDERDRIIGWRAEARTSWLLTAGVFLALAALVAGWPAAHVAHLLLVSVFVAELARFSLQIVYYRRGL